MFTETHERTILGPLPSVFEAAVFQRTAWRKNDMHSPLAAVVVARLLRCDCEPSYGTSDAPFIRDQVKLRNSYSMLHTHCTHYTR